MTRRFSLLFLAALMPSVSADRLAWTDSEEGAVLRAILPEVGMRFLERLPGDGEGVPLPEDAPPILWAGFLPPALADRGGPLVAVGTFGEKTGIEEWIDPAAPESGPALPWPPGVSLAPHLHWEAFGSEERVSWKSEGDAIVVKSEAGEAPAGIVSGTGGRPPAEEWCGARPLELRFRGQGEWSLAADFGIPGKDPEVLATWEAEAGPRTLTVDPGRLPQGKAFRFTLVAPRKGGSLQLESLRFGGPSGSSAGSARWDWSTENSRWQGHRGTWREIAAAYPRDLRELPGASDGWRKELAVAAVEGDPAMILPGEGPKLAGRVRALGLLGPAWRPDAIQLDIEPYILPGYAQQPAHWNRRWLDTLRVAKAAAPGLPLEVVLPWWAVVHPDFSAFLGELPAVADRVAVMNYRTDPIAALQTAAAWMEWGARHRRPVAMAVELGPLPDATSRRFEPGRVGTLWLTDAGPAGTLAVLFGREVAGVPSGRLLKATGPDRVRPAAVTTFHGRPAAAVSLAEMLAALPPAVPGKDRPVFFHEPPGGFAPPAGSGD